MGKLADSFLPCNCIQDSDHLLLPAEAAGLTPSDSYDFLPIMALALSTYHHGSNEITVNC